MDITTNVKDVPKLQILKVMFIQTGQSTTLKDIKVLVFVAKPRTENINMRMVLISAVIVIMKKKGQSLFLWGEWTA